jgi:hypothetical protein
MIFIPKRGAKKKALTNRIFNPETNILNSLRNNDQGDTYPHSTSNRDLNVSYPLKNILRNFEDLNYSDLTLLMNNNFIALDDQYTEDVKKYATSIYKRNSNENFGKFCDRKRVYNFKTKSLELGYDDICRLLAEYLGCEIETAKFISDCGFSMGNNTIGFGAMLMEKSKFFLFDFINYNYSRIPRVQNTVATQKSIRRILTGHDKKIKKMAYKGLRGAEEFICEMELRPGIFDVWYEIRYIDPLPLPRVLRGVRVHYEISCNVKSKFLRFNKYEVGNQGQWHVDMEEFMKRNNGLSKFGEANN